MSSSYHHGDLPSTLRAAAVDLIATAGPSGFSLREVARRAGVSHAAPAHHFGDARGLLTSVATEGYSLLAEQMSKAASGPHNARDALIQCGTAYIETALANPGHYGVMIDHSYTDQDNEQLVTASSQAYAQLLVVVNALRDEYNPDLDIDATATLCWATVHGLVELAPILGHVAENTDTSVTSIPELLVKLADMIIDRINVG